MGRSEDLIRGARSGRCQGVPGDGLPLSVPTDHRLGMLLWGAMGSGMFLSSVLTGCIGSRVRGGSLKFQSVMTWAGLILIVAAKKAYLAFLSRSFSLLASFSLLLNILKAIFRRSLWGGLRALF